MLLEAPLFKKKQANSCLSLSLSLDRPCGNKHKFCKIPPQKKDFRENLTSWDASNVIRSTTVEERKAITHLSLMIEKKEQEAITHVSLSLSLSLCGHTSLPTQKHPACGAAHQADARMQAITY